MQMPLRQQANHCVSDDISFAMDELLHITDQIGTAIPHPTRPLGGDGTDCHELPARALMISDVGSTVTNLRLG